MEKAIVRDFRFDNLRAIMVIGIVLEHSLLIYGYPRSHEFVWALTISWLMPLFTVISGYFFKKRDVKELCNKYLYPMMLFSSVNFIVGYFVYPKYNGGIHLVGYAMWYLLALFVMAKITPPHLSNKMLFILLVFSIVSTMIYQLLPLPSWLNYISLKLQLNRIVGFYPFFLSGIILRKNLYKIVDKHTPAKWRCVLFACIALYLLLCMIFEGLAYKSSFYLCFASGLSSVAQITISYFFILPICLLLILSVPNKESVISKFGSRTMNVYLLHMIVVFLLCYGVFSHLNDSVLIKVLNSLLACIVCFFFFSDVVDRIMKKILGKPNWGIALPLYVASLCLVNIEILQKIYSLIK